MQDIINLIKLNMTIMERNHKSQYIAALIVAGTAFTRNLWLVALIILLGTLFLGVKKIFTTSLFEIDGYTYMSFPVSFKAVAISKVITAGTQLLLVNASIVLVVQVLKMVVFGGEASQVGGYLYEWFMDAEGDYALLVQIIQWIDAALLCYAIPSITLMLVTLDKTVIKNGHYAYTILAAMFLVAGMWMIGESYQITLKLALIQFGVILFFILFCLWQTWSFLEQAFTIRNPIDY